MEEVFSVMKKAEPKENVKCEVCSRLPSVAFCQQCSKYICVKCDEAHKTMYMFSTHKVVSIDSLTKSTADSLPVVHQEVKCSKHRDEVLKLYCRDCHKLVCRDCILIDHKDHDYAFVIDAAPQCKVEIEGKVEAVKKISVGLKSTVKSLNDSEKKLSDHSTATMKAIDDAVDQVASKLMQKKKELKEEACRVVNKVKEDIATQEKNALLAMGEVESLLDFLHRNLKKATDQEVLSLKKQMSEQVERVSRLYSDPIGKFPVPQLPLLEVLSGGKVMQAIQNNISITDRKKYPPSFPTLPAPMVIYKPDDPPTGEQLTGATNTHTGSKSPSPSPSPGTSGEERNNVFTNLNPDALALLQRLSEGDIPGIEYNVREGYVRIQGEDIEEAFSKFQDAYKKVVVSPGRRLRAENVAIPAARSKKEVKEQIAKFELQYLYCAFVLDEKNRQVRVISQSRQFEQAKQFLSDALQQPLATSDVSTLSTPAASLVIAISKKRTLTLKKADIVQEKADILVNAANGRLRPGGVVAGALNAASQGKLQVYCNKYMEKKRKGKELAVGEVAVTHAGGELKCLYVIHAVGPDSATHTPSQSERLVKVAIRNTLEAAEKHNVVSIALPALSCGIFGVSKDLVARSMINAIRGFTFSKPPPTLSDIRIVIIDEPTHSHFACYFQHNTLSHTLSRK